MYVCLRGVRRNVVRDFQCPIERSGLIHHIRTGGGAPRAGPRRGQYGQRDRRTRKSTTAMDWKECRLLSKSWDSLLATAQCQIKAVLPLVAKLWAFRDL